MRPGSSYREEVTWFEYRWLIKSPPPSKFLPQHLTTANLSLVLSVPAIRFLKNLWQLKELGLVDKESRRNVLRWWFQHRPSLPNTIVLQAGQFAHLGGVKTVNCSQVKDQSSKITLGVNAEIRWMTCFRPFMRMGLQTFSRFFSLQVPSLAKNTGLTIRFQQGLYFPGMYG